ncbi:MAG: hypothetical protein ACK4UO_02190 [Pseudolabrys sp.]
MSDSTENREARVFAVETRFQKLARQPGGIPRDKALENAQSKVEEIKPGFEDWAGTRLQELAEVVKQAEAGTAPDDWIETANLHSRYLRDVGTTMGFDLLTYIANSLCEVLDAVAAGAECNMESITCHLDALFLSRQQPYRKMKPEQVPELISGLRRVVDFVSTSPT